MDDGYIHGVGVDEYRLPPLPEEDEELDEDDGATLVLLDATELVSDNRELTVSHICHS